MKRILIQNYYELLEIPRVAPPDEIRRAYLEMKEAFREDSLAIYSLFDPKDLTRIQKRLEEAFHTLMDEKLRQAYDLSLRSSFKHEGRGDRVISTEETLEKTLLDQEFYSPATVGETDPELDEFLQNIEEKVNGYFLKRYREAKGFPLEWIAKETRINITYLQYIESDRYDSLPHPVYLKGYLFQYANLLGIDSNQVVTGFLNQYHSWRSLKEGS